MIEYGLYTEADEDEMVRLLATVFPAHDPPAVAVELSPSEFEPFVRALCPRAAAEALTVVARTRETGEIVGALLTEDSAPHSPETFRRLSPKFGPIFDLLGQLETEYRAGRAPRPGEAAHLFLLGVDARFGGRGIAQGLVTAVLAHASARGYRVAVTEATNRRSQHVFRKLGFRERVRRSYVEHRFRDLAWFGSIADQGGPILMTRDL